MLSLGGLYSGCVFYYYSLKGEEMYMKRTTNWYFEWNVFSKYERALICIDFCFPTPKNKSFLFGIAVFTLSIFYIEIAYCPKENK